MVAVGVSDSDGVGVCLVPVCLCTGGAGTRMVGAFVQECPGGLYTGEKFYRKQRRNDLSAGVGGGYAGRILLKQKSLYPKSSSR